MKERFNKTFRENILDAYAFDNLNEVRTVTEEWIWDYNNYRPHDALGGLSPKHYKQKAEKKIHGLRYTPATPAVHSTHESFND